MSGRPSPVSIRAAASPDVPAIRALAGQLGYPAAEEQTARRFAAVANDPNQAVIVATVNGQVVGWAHAVRQELLVVNPRADLGGIVVDEQHRGQGIGALLLAAAEQWARERGCENLQVRSNALRAEAHRFYERRGYSCTKTSKVFRKDLQ
jgi:GNAT superfamily N-acetyltransferase